jgi:hypothetical protein
MSRNWFKSGEWNVYCMVCNRKIKAGIALKRWDGLIVCPEDYENRHPMDFLRSRQERISVPFTSDTSFDQFDGPNYPVYPYCTAMGASGIPSWAIAGCMRPNLGYPNNLPVHNPEIPDEPLFVYLQLMTGGFWLTKATNLNLVTVSLD